MESVIVKMDRFGRVLLPKEVRNEVGADTFVVQTRPKEIRFKAIPTIEEAFGSMPWINMRKFKKQREEDRRE